MLLSCRTSVWDWVVTDGSPGGTVALSNVNDGRQISEPNAQLRFTNARTGESTVITLDPDALGPWKAAHGKPAGCPISAQRKIVSD